jgi:hypothetical protein
MDDTIPIPIMILIPGKRFGEKAVCRLPRDTTTRRYYEELKRQVEAITGDPMEHVNVFTDFGGGREYRYLDMFVNEAGHLQGMQRNERATEIYRNNVMVHEPFPPPAETLPWIAGPAVLFSERVWF